MTALRLPAVALAALAMGLALPAGAADTPKSATAILKDASGKEAGKVVLKPGGHHGLEGTVDVKGLTPGEHGVHIHAVGKCEGDFASAGGHLNPTSKKHGLKNPEGPHLGDLPALVAKADGSGHLTFPAHTDFAALFDADGAAFVVHAGPDDQMTDPSGNSGGRVLCGVFTPGK